VRHMQWIEGAAEEAERSRGGFTHRE
jgi:hypothetical protein